MASPANLLRLGLVAFLVTTLVLRLPTSVREAAHPSSVSAVTCTNSCEAAGACWPIGFVGTDGPTGCKATCTSGGWGQTNCNTTQQEKDTARALYNQYQQQQSGQSTTTTTTTTTATASNANAVCNSPSANGCAGKAFYSEPNGAPGWQCFPNGVNATTGLPVCGRVPASQANPTAINPVTGAREGGYLVTTQSTNTSGQSIPHTNPSAGGCAAVMICGCATGQVSMCLSDPNLVGSNPANYCATKVCTPIGTVVNTAQGAQTKVCTPGQVSECIPGTTQGRYCNLTGTDWTTVSAHACGATHTVAYCSNSTSSSSTGTVCASGATTYDTLAECQAAGGGSSCVRGVAQIKQPEAGSMSSFCLRYGSVSSQGYKDCMIDYSTGPNAAANRAADAELFRNAGACVPGVSFSVFKGCGTGTQSRYNCYNNCKNGVISTSCSNEPGLSCGAHENNVVAQTIASVEQRFNPPTTPTSPQPSPRPTPTPTATCGQSCGSSAGGAYCTGSNMACVSGTCRSTLCSVSEQNNQCICASPPPNPPICVDIYASKTNIKLNDQVSFTCAAVANATSYQFRWGYLKKSEGVEGIVMQDLQSSSATSRTSVPITVDKVGRYIAQCRPCAANNLCSEWEPVGGENSVPELEPGTSATQSGTLQLRKS